jgi:hypothetical protein
MSVTTTMSNGAAKESKSASEKKKRRHTPGGVALGQDVSREAQKTAAAILEVLAGGRTPAQAAEALGMSLPRYFQLETRAMHALVKSCEAKPRGPSRSADKELAALKRQYDRLQRELARQQTLVRMAQRTIGLAAPAKPPPGQKKRRRPVVRALKAAVYLQERGQEAAAAAVPETQDNHG